jgi:hypothetical protein
MAHFDFDKSSTASSVVSSRSVEEQDPGTYSGSDVEDDLETIVDGASPTTKRSASPPPPPPPPTAESDKGYLRALVETLIESRMGKKKSTSRSSKKRASSSSSSGKAKKGKSASAIKEAQKKLTKFRKLANQMTSL